MRVPPHDGGIIGERVHEGAGQVQAEGTPGTPWVGRAQPAGFGAEGMAEVGEALAQAVQGSRRGGLRPKQAGQPFSLYLASVAQGEECESRLALTESEAWERPAVQTHHERSEQPDAQWR